MARVNRTKGKAVVGSEALVSMLKSTKVATVQRDNGTVCNGIESTQLASGRFSTVIEIESDDLDFYRYDTIDRKTKQPTKANASQPIGVVGRSMRGDAVGHHVTYLSGLELDLDGNLFVRYNCSKVVD